MTASSGTTGTKKNNASGAVSADRSAATSGEKRVGVLSFHNSKETKAILNAIRALGHEPVWIRDENVSSWIQNGNVHLSPDVDVLINRMLLTKSDHQLEDLQLAALYEESVPVLNSPQAVSNILHKYRTGAKLAEAGLPVPDAFFGRSPRTMQEWDEYLPDDAAHKRTIGTNGHGMSVVSTGEQVGPRINDDHSFVQEFLDKSDDRPSDVRAYVVDGEIVGAMRRYAPEGEWRTNVALGGKVEGVTEELPEAARRLAIEATSVLNLDLAGVDLMSVEGNWYILEINATAGFKGLFSATGVSVAPHIAELAIERVGGAVEQSLVRDLAETLDDSVPEEKPTPATEEGDAEVLGYTTRIGINGRDGAEQTIAKSDTGARRTSIDTELAGRIGAGPLEGTTEVRSGTGSGTETRPLVDIDLCLNGRWRTVTASITDRSEMKYPVLLGRDVLESFTLDISQRAEE